MELEALFLSLVATATVFPLHVFMCRVFGSKKAVRWMFVSFLITGALVFAYWHSCYQLNVLTLPAWIMLGACCLFWDLGYMEAFSMLCRGFSLGILVSLSEHPGLSVNEVMSTYGGVGAQGLMRKRLESMERLGLIQQANGTLRLSDGWPVVLAGATLTYKRVLKLGKGG